MWTTRIFKPICHLLFLILKKEQNKTKPPFSTAWINKTTTTKQDKTKQNKTEQDKTKNKTIKKKLCP